MSANEPPEGKTQLHDDLDRLIDWYEAHKPGAGGEIRVGVSRRTVMRWGIKPAARGGEIEYRGRRLLTK